MSEKSSSRIGHKFNNLTIVGNAGVDKNYCKLVECLCECGVKKVVRLSAVVTGEIKSCGCYRKQRAADLSKTHGLLVGTGGETRLHRIWSNMKARCSNQNHKAFKNYGGRGIAVCCQWTESYEKFHAWAISSGYSDSLTIERIDNDSGYSPQNCKWIPKTKQVENRRANKINAGIAEEIRIAVSCGESRKSVALRFGISKSHVDSITSHRRW